uniref:Uncharacterized protein n=1 Tax=Anguilla anguilla TaxID=7936 RepID=A0A0E9RUX0_ANGAN
MVTGPKKTHLQSPHNHLSPWQRLSRSLSLSLSHSFTHSLSLLSQVSHLISFSFFYFFSFD